MFVADATSPVPVVFPPEGVFVLESRHGKAFHMEATAHAYWKILFAFRGSGWLIEFEKRRIIADGDVALVPPKVSHRLEDDRENPLSLYVICIETDFLRRCVKDIGLSPTLQLYHRPVWTGELAGLLRSLLIEQSRSIPGSPAWITGLAWQIVGILWRAGWAKKKTPPSRYSKGVLSNQRVMDYVTELDQTFFKNTDLDEVAATLGLGRRRFTQIFRELTGKSWLQKIRELRVAHARRLLLETDRSVAAVAFESGFSDLSHFYRVFREVSPGCSPARLRANAVNESQRRLAASQRRPSNRHSVVPAVDS